MGDMADWDAAAFDDSFSRQDMRRRIRETRNATISMLLQNKVWQAWDRDASQFVDVPIPEMERQHAKNAMRWMRKNQKRITSILLSSRRALSSDFDIYDVTTLPVYDALRERVKIPPFQSFTRKELGIISEVLSDDVPPDLRNRCSRIAKKARMFRDMDA